MDTLPATAGHKVPDRKKYTKEELRLDTQYFSQRVMAYLLSGDRLEQLLSESKLKDLAVIFGITTEKLLLLEGQPTQIISQQQHQKIDELLPRLAEEMKRRNLKVNLTERKAELTVSP